jgi:hypothetical protein
MPGPCSPFPSRPGLSLNAPLFRRLLFRQLLLFRSSEDAVRVLLHLFNRRDGTVQLAHHFLIAGEAELVIWFLVELVAVALEVFRSGVSALEHLRRVICCNFAIQSERSLPFPARRQLNSGLHLYCYP